MAKMHFKYASMNAGKSIDLIKTCHNYEENGYKILVVKSAIDTKGDSKITSRIGVEREVDAVFLYSDSILEKLKGLLDGISCILVDEAQFLSEKQIEELFIISKACDITVICYGLRNNFKMESFAGSKKLLEIADVLEELPTLCSCGKTARFVGRKIENKYVLDGDEIIIDGALDITYVPLCGACFLKKVRCLNLEKINKEMKGI